MTEHPLKIDSHHHFWRYKPAEYGWISDSMPSIQRDFLPSHLQAEMLATGIDGAVSVQARQNLAETQWLLDQANQHDFIKGVVGWVELTSPTCAVELERFVTSAKFKAVRHVIHDESDDQYILREDFNRGVRLLKTFGLSYDILVFEHHLPQTIRFVDQHSQQIFVLDHIAKPRIRLGEVEPWAKNIRELARRPNVYCKLSGMVTEANFTSWTEEQLRPYFDIVLDAFGPQRLMFGTDWPVCLLACSYVRWHQIASRWLSDLSTNEQAHVFGRTASEAYRL